MKTILMTWIWNPTALILLGGTISLIGTFWATREQVAAERESRTRAEKTLSYIQGDHSLEIAHRFDNNVLTLFVRNMSDIPTYGLTTRVIDVDAYGYETIQSMEDILKKPSPIYEEYRPDLAAKALTQILSLRLDEKKKANTFKIFLSSRKGQSEVLIKFKKIGSDWTSQIQ